MSKEFCKRSRSPYITFIKLFPTTEERISSQLAANNCGRFSCKKDQLVTRGPFRLDLLWVRFPYQNEVEIKRKDKLRIENHFKRFGMISRRLMTYDITFNERMALV